MSYLTQHQDPRRRAGAFAGTIAFNAGIAVLLATGLTVVGIGPKPRSYDPVEQFPLPQPPPPPEPAPMPSAASQDPVAPPQPFPLPPQPGPQVDVREPDPTAFPEVAVRPDPGPGVAPTPRPSPSFTPRGARPAGDSASWITTDDYPRRSLMDGSEGTARYRVVIGTNGRVSSCEVTASTGDRQLDEATCRFITRRARFEPATDENGAKVLGTFSGTVRWQLPR